MVAGRCGCSVRTDGTPNHIYFKTVLDSLPSPSTHPKPPVRPVSREKLGTRYATSATPIAMHVRRPFLYLGETEGEELGLS